MLSGGISPLVWLQVKLAATRDRESGISSLTNRLFSLTFFPPPTHDGWGGGGGLEGRPEIPTWNPPAVLRPESPSDVRERVELCWTFFPTKKPLNSLSLSLSLSLTHTHTHTLFPLLKTCPEFAHFAQISGDGLVVQGKRREEGKRRKLHSRHTDALRQHRQEAVGIEPINRLVDF